MLFGKYVNGVEKFCLTFIHVISVKQMSDGMKGLMFKKKLNPKAARRRYK